MANYPLLMLQLLLDTKGNAAEITMALQFHKISQLMNRYHLKTLAV